MAVLLNNTFRVNQEYTLTCLPRKGNTIFSKIKDLKVGDTFIFKSNSSNGLLMQHKKTGVVHPLQACFFVNGDRFYYTHSRKEVATALIVIDSTTIFSGNKSRKVEVGTIFDSFKNYSDTQYIVTVNNGLEYRIAKNAVSKLCDIEYEPSQEDTVSSLVEEVNKEVVDASVKEVSKDINYTIALNGINFPSIASAMKAEAFTEDFLDLLKKHQIQGKEETGQCLQLALSLI